ncbi:MAG: hypothetical protein LBD69_03085 [Puniceicoccales bacterium]|jgi:hypothetical protein|nr:hypothetical protein [Puniceicoccales bacterium]
MNTLPTELISLLGSSLFGSSMRLVSLALLTRHRERLFALHKRHLLEISIANARNTPHKGIQLTRRMIALMAVFFVIAFPKLMALLHPELPISVGYSQISNGFLFFSSYEKIQWTQLKGLVITPLDTHLLSAIIGLYFGSALVDANT